MTVAHAQPRHMADMPPQIPYQDAIYMPDAQEEWHAPFSIEHHIAARMVALTIIFALGSIAGWLYETAFDLIQGHGLVIRAQFVLPWCPIYGIGCAILEMVVGRGFDRRAPDAAHIAACLATSAILVTACELVASYALEATSGAFPWDYSAYPLNFEGRVAAPFTTLFAIGGTLMLTFVHPWVHRQVDESPTMAIAFATTIILLMAIELVIQSTGRADEMRSYMVHHSSILLHDHGVDMPVSIQSANG